MLGGTGFAYLSRRYVVGLCVGVQTACDFRWILQHSHLSVYGPSCGYAKLFQQVALPCGTRYAVNTFTRCYGFLQWIAARIFILPLICYFDDFVAFFVLNRVTIARLSQRLVGSMGLSNRRPLSGQPRWQG